jgi:hypothetical protein
MDYRFTLKIVFDFSLDFIKIFEKYFHKNCQVRKTPFHFSVVLGLFTSRIDVFSKKYLFKIDSNPLIVKDLIQRCLICISAVSDCAKSASALSETTLTQHQRRLT